MFHGVGFYHVCNGEWCTFCCLLCLMYLVVLFEAFALAVRYTSFGSCRTIYRQSPMEFPPGSRSLSIFYRQYYRTNFLLYWKVFDEAYAIHESLLVYNEHTTYMYVFVMLCTLPFHSPYVSLHLHLFNKLFFRNSQTVNYIDINNTVLEDQYIIS